MSSKTNVLSVWKEHFSVFCKFLSDEVKTTFWENEAKGSKLFKSKFGHRKLLRKWFWSYLELKNECSEHLKKTFCKFLQNFWVMKLKPFSRKVRQSVQSYLKKNLVIGNFLENGFDTTLSWKTNVLSLWKKLFPVFSNFWVRKLKPFSEKGKQSAKIYLNQKFEHKNLLKKCFFGATLRSKTKVVSVW